MAEEHQATCRLFHYARAQLGGDWLHSDPINAQNQKCNTLRRKGCRLGWTHLSELESRKWCVCIQKQQMLGFISDSSSTSDTAVQQRRLPVEIQKRLLCYDHTTGTSQTGNNCPLGRDTYLLDIDKSLVAIVNQLQKYLFEPLQFDAISNRLTLLCHAKDKGGTTMVRPDLANTHTVRLAPRL